MLKNPRFVMATIVMAFISVIAVTLPLSAAESQSYMGTTNDANSSAPAIPSGMLPTDDKIGPVGIVNELYDAHSTITGIMIDHANMNYSKAENFVFVMTVVDEDNEKLNIILDPVMLTLGLAYDEADVIELVKIDVHMIDVKYGIYTPDGHISPSSQSSIDLWISLYNARCDSPTASRLCEALYFNLGTQNHYVLDSNNRWQPAGTESTQVSDPVLESSPKQIPLPDTLSTTMFFDGFEYETLGNWTNTGYKWSVGDFDGDVQPQGHNDTNGVASADRCITQCVLTLADPVDTSNENRTMFTFHRYVDESLDSGEYLRVDVTNGNGTWTQLAKWAGNSEDADSKWHFERYDITPHTSDALQVRFVARMNSLSEDVGIDDVTISKVLEFYGGNKYTIWHKEPGKSKVGYEGTMTVGITNSSTGTKGILTAGHNIILDEDTEPFHSHTVGKDDSVFNREPDGWFDIASVDAAFVPIEDPHIVIGSKIQALNGTIMNVTYGNLSDISRGSKISIYGIENNDDGFLYYKNATIHNSATNTLFNMGIAGYDSKKGDSGAPIIHHNSSGSHNLVGIHTGGICAFESPSEGQAKIVIPAHIKWCNVSDDVYFYKVFSALENVIKVLNLQ